jgi:two-component system cell cycle response regulator DivK
MTRRRVLIVDDNPSNLKLLEFLLSGPSYDVKTATSGHEALAVLDTFDAELLLLDLQLPDLDGLSLLKRVRHNEHTRHLPVIAVTAYAMLGDEERARAAGVDDYLTKPIDKQLFRKKVAEHLRKRGKHEA